MVTGGVGLMALGSLPMAGSAGERIFACIEQGGRWTLNVYKDGTYRQKQTFREKKFNAPALSESTLDVKVDGKEEG